ncbi:16S rRNA (guanine(527)-N(7))-methyltransferase RsmG [Yoonia sp. SS1-5]|uniref:Ribosomal RNA small subunit methyltransferase G n=1 Tax=Yoonia rhodophyticola TaxID=3137370 RepID=A0AAN0NM04_9RHOB
MGDLIAEQLVSRETMTALQEFEALVRKWTKSINLVAPSTINDIWDRHIVDSAQIFKYAPDSFRTWTDIGSGGGFPGIVVAIMAREHHPTSRFTFIESDRRKATFLRTAIRTFDLRAAVLDQRIEQAVPQQADVVSARALTSLSMMFEMLQRHLSPQGIAVLHKGRRHDNEVAEARKLWRFELEEHASLTDPEARILAIQGIQSATD